jgi:pimeloyl-ACP methyl ester carboxylesterase
MRGYAEVAVQVLQHLNIEDVVVLGWSLGGHVGIEMLELVNQPQSIASAKKIKIKGLVLTGTPPALGADQVAAGFTMGGGLGQAGQRHWTDEEAEAFARNSAAAGREECFEAWMLEDARNTDGRARMVMGERFVGGEGVDQVRVVETTEVPIAVVNGAQEQFVNLDYLDTIKWGNLWRGECVRLDGLHHAPFWEDPQRYEQVLVEFLQDVEKE